MNCNAFLSLLGQMLLLAALWEAIASEGVADTWLCAVVAWCILPTVHRLIDLIRSPENNTLDIRHSAVRLAIAIASSVAFNTTSPDSPLQILYLIITAVAGMHRRALCFDPLLAGALSITSIFALGVVRHEWWYCGLKSQPCSFIGGTHVVFLCGLVSIAICCFLRSRAPQCLHPKAPQSLLPPSAPRTDYCKSTPNIPSVFSVSSVVLSNPLNYVRSIMRCPSLRLVNFCLGSAIVLAVVFCVSQDVSARPTAAPFTIDTSVGVICCGLLVCILFGGALIYRQILPPSVGHPQLSAIACFALLLGMSSIIIYSGFQVQKLGKVDHAPEVEVLPECLVQALLVAEDPTFFSHSGVDFVRIRDAFAELFEAGEYRRGGSTIPMQLAKVLFLSYEKTALRKLRQIALAVMLEWRFSKREILQHYLNAVPFADGVIGIQAAAEELYHTKVSQLTCEQSLRLVLSIYDPTIHLHNGESFSEKTTFSPSVSIRASTIKARVKAFGATIQRQWRLEGE